MGNVDWLQQARSHDALMLRYNYDGWKLDLAGAFNQAGPRLFSTDYRPFNYKVLTMLHAQKHSDKFSWNGIFVSDAFEKSDSIHDLVWRYTLGTFMKYKTGDLSLSGSAYWQGGKTRFDQNIAAFLF